jgi:hypothetical protein
MKTKTLFAGLITALSLAAIILSSFGHFQNELFYYAFNEKIQLETVPNKFVLRYANSDAAKSKLSSLEKQSFLKAEEWRDERTAVISFLKTDVSAMVLDLQNQTDVISVQPLYRTVKEKLDVAATDEILVRFKKDFATTDIDSTIKTYNLHIVQKGELFYTFSVPKNANTLQIANSIMESGVAEFSHPNFYRHIDRHQIPNDEFFNYQWNLHNTGQVINDGHTGTPGADIRAPEAWLKTRGSSSIIIAVLDEGVTSNHPDLLNGRQVRLNGSNFSTAIPGNDPSPVGDGNHGNACSGIIAATRNNSEGIAGVAPKCKIMPVKVLNPSASDANIANAITFAKTNGAHILSNSWGYGTSNSNYVPAIVTAIQDAVTNGRGGLGCVVVFAAGNTADHAGGNNGFVTFPGNVNIAGVLTVGASDRYDHQANYSGTSNTLSPDNQIIDIVAPSHKAYSCQIPGETFEVWSMDIPGTAGYNTWHESGSCMNPPALGAILPSSGTNYQSYTGRMGGTSAACPQVAGAAALVLSLNPNLTQQQVFNILTQNADKVGGYSYNSSGFSNEMGYGRLNLYRAVWKAGADLYMKDQITDAGLEPNPDNVSPYYVSPDIWVRNANDGGTTHQNPEYGQTNYVYVKVRNRGYIASTGTGDNLKLYWAKASTGLSWTFPWTGATYNCSGNPLSIGGIIGTQAVAAISAGSYTTLVFPWNPPKPDDFQPCFGADASHFCLLARIETSVAVPYGMAFPETTNLWNNVRNNNNIVWKNISIVDVLPNTSIVRTSVLLTGGKLIGRSFTITDLAFNVPGDKGNNNILTVADVDIDLGDFTKPWLSAGGKVEGGRMYEDKNGKILIRLIASKGTIYGIPVDPAQMGSVTVAIMQKTFSPGKLFLFDVQQLDRGTIVGGERFDIQFKDKPGIAKAPAIQQADAKAVTKSSPLKVYQNGKQLNIQMNDGKEYLVTISNSFGQVYSTLKMTNQASVPVSSYNQGVYYIKLISLKEHTAYSATTMIQ